MTSKIFVLLFSVFIFAYFFISCGTLGNNCGQVAKLFKKALTSRFRGCFKHVVFSFLHDPEVSASVSLRVFPFLSVFLLLFAGFQSILCRVWSSKNGHSKRD